MLKNFNIKYLIKSTFILGNISCDLDSFLSSILLSLSKNILNNNNNNFHYYFPLINCKREELKYRFDIDYLIKRFGINTKNMLFIDDKIINNLLNKKNFNLILVDHNNFDISQKNLFKKWKISEIYDHHKDEKLNIKNKNIIYPLGSCTTLILNKFFLPNPFLLNYIHPLLSISAILTDTENFNKEIYNKRWVDLDKNVYDFILNNSKLNYNFDEKFINKFYLDLYKEKYSKEKNLNLGINGMLFKDKKNYKWNKNILAGISTIQIKFETMVKKFGLKNIINEINKICKKENNNIYIICYNDKLNNNKCKSFILFNYNLNQINFNILINDLKKILNNKCLKIENISNNQIKFYVDNSISRKHFEPIIKNLFNNNKYI